MPGMPVIIGDLVLDPCVFDKYAPLARARSAARCSNITLLALDETLNRLLTSNDKAIAFPFNPQEGQVVPSNRTRTVFAVLPIGDVNKRIHISPNAKSDLVYARADVWLLMRLRPLRSRLLHACKSPVHFCRVRCV